MLLALGDPLAGRLVEHLGHHLAHPRLHGADHPRRESLVEQAALAHVTLAVEADQRRAGPLLRTHPLPRAEHVRVYRHVGHVRVAGQDPELVGVVPEDRPALLDPRTGRMRIPVAGAIRDVEIAGRSGFRTKPRGSCSPATPSTTALCPTSSTVRTSRRISRRCGASAVSRSRPFTAAVSPASSEIVRSRSAISTWPPGAQAPTVGLVPGGRQAGRARVAIRSGA